MTAFKYRSNVNHNINSYEIYALSFVFRLPGIYNSGASHYSNS